MKKRQAETLLEICVARGGMVKGMRTATFVVQWAIALEELGPEMTLEQAAEWWRENERTWYRRLKDFRTIFGQVSPTPVAQAMLAKLAEQDELPTPDRQDQLAATVARVMAQSLAVPA